MIVTSSYLVYLLISVGLTMWVGRTLYKNGAYFLVDVFKGNKQLAEAVNHLLVVGFYLLNFGFVSFNLKMSSPPTTTQAAIEDLSVKIGIVLIVLGVLHLTNIYVFNRLRTRSEYMDRPLPPVRPDGRTGPGHDPMFPIRPPA